MRNNGDNPLSSDHFLVPLQKSFNQFKDMLL